MDISKNLAELLAKAFTYYSYPLRHAEYVFPHGGEVVRVTVTVEKNAKEYDNAMEQLGWVTTQSSN